MIYVGIDELVTGNICTLNQIGSSSTVIQQISVHAAFGESIVYEPAQYFANLIPDFTATSLTIRTIDSDGEPLNWNGGSWTVTLGIVWSVDVGLSGQEDVTGGRIFRPLLHSTPHDPLQTTSEHQRKRNRN